MSLRCQNCGKEIPDFPEEKVEKNELEEVVGHKHGKDTDSLAITTKDYYCNPECFAKAHSEAQA